MGYYLCIYITDFEDSIVTTTLSNRWLNKQIFDFVAIDNKMSTLDTYRLIQVS